ncbi:MAG: hypothetical protein AB1638_09305 [Nitrospirota bacterium]
MVRYLPYTQVLILVLLLFQAVSLPVVLAEENSVLSIDEVLKNVDPAKVTKAQVKEYYKEVSGKKVKGEGTIVNVFPGTRDTHRIAVLAAGSDPEKGYNVMLYVTQETRPDVNKNDRIAFEGEISRLSAYKGALIDIHRTSFRKIEAKQ